MKLGTETASLINHIMANGSTKTVAIGDPATLLSWTDRRPATVVDQFKKGKYFYIVVQEDKAEHIGEKCMSDQQEYEYSRNPEGSKTTWRIDSGFKRVIKSESGRYKLANVGGLMVGRREKYHDHSF